MKQTNYLSSFREASSLDFTYQCDRGSDMSSCRSDREVSITRAGSSIPHKWRDKNIIRWENRNVAVQKRELEVIALVRRINHIFISTKLGIVE